MLWRIYELIGKFCLAILLMCIVYQVTFLAMAYAAEHLTDPPACQVRFAFPLPFAVCPGFRLGLSVDYAMALPGAVLALPFLLPGLLADTGSSLQLFVAIPVLIHIFAWSYLIISWFHRKVAS